MLRTNSTVCRQLPQDRASAASALRFGPRHRQRADSRLCVRVRLAQRHRRRAGDRLPSVSGLHFPRRQQLGREPPRPERLCRLPRGDGPGSVPSAPVDQQEPARSKATGTTRVTTAATPPPMQTAPAVSESCARVGHETCRGGDRGSRQRTRAKTHVCRVSSRQTRVCSQTPRPPTVRSVDRTILLNTFNSDCTAEGEPASKGSGLAFAPAAGIARRQILGWCHSPKKAVQVPHLQQS